MLQAFEGLPINVGVLGKGNGSIHKSLRDQIEAGACGLKLHEDWGTTLKVIETSLEVADEYDIQIAIHTDTLNECGFIDDSIAAIKGRAIHSFHTEGAGGGHAPDIIKIAGLPNVLPSSTNPTRPFTVNTIDEHLDMLMVCHHLSRDIPEDVAFAESRIRAETIGAEDVFHDRGIISMTSSDSQAMGRIGEAIVRTWQTAHKMKVQLGALPGDSDRNDNERVKRYVAKYTINPAITHGIAQHVGSIEGGKLADLVLYDPAYFGVKPFLVLKGGLLVAAQMGDPNASIATPQPVYMRPQFAAFGRALSKSCLSFVSKASLNAGIVERYGLQREVVAVEHCRDIGKKDMRRNEATPEIRVDADTYQVWVDGEKVSSEPLAALPMTQRVLPLLIDALASRVGAAARTAPSRILGLRIPMNLRLLQIADSALPIGGYTHSWGLEGAIARGLVHDPESLERWTGQWLRTSLAPLEGVLVASGCRAARAGIPADLLALNRLAGASIVPPSTRGASREMGEQLLALGATWAWSASELAPFLRTRPEEPDGWHHPVAFGLLGALAGGGPEDVLTAYLHQAALGMIGAGVRAIPVGHTHGQQVLAYLQDDIRNLAAELCDRDPETAGAGCPFYEVLCDEQTRLYARMFRS